MKIKTILLGCMAAGVVMPALALDKPTAYTSRFEKHSYVSSLSDNGRYAVFANVNEENSLFDDYPIMVDFEDNGKAYDMLEGAGKYVSAGVRDVSNTGVCVGNFGETASVAATWTKEEGWKALPGPINGFPYEGGYATSITPDGKFAVGYMFYNGGFAEQPVLWNLETRRPVATPNLPTVDLDGDKSEQVRFISISADGKKILGVLAYSYPNSMITFVYDVDKQDYTALGMSKKGEGDNARFTPLYSGLHHVDEGVLSNNGRYVGFNAYMVGGELGDEFQCVAVYDMENDEYTYYDDQESMDTKIGAVSNEGVAYMNTPAASPIRSWYVRSGKYWVPFDKILRQTWGMTIENLTRYTEVTSGSVLCLDDSALKLASLIMAQTGESYVLTLPETADKLGLNVDLLSDYSVSPTPGAKFSTVRDITLNFDRAIEVVGDNNSVSLVDGSGNVVKNSIKVAANAANAMQLDISFRTVTLDDGKKYEVVIPAGTLQIQGDPEKKNSEIRIEYVGRAAGAVKPVSFAPAEGAPVSTFNMTSNPVLVTFDTNIKLCSTASGVIEELNADGSVKTAIADLYFAASGSTLQVFPMNQINLYQGSKYRITVNANTVTDMIGDNANEQFSVTYEGRFENDFKNDEGYLRIEHFNDGLWLSSWLFYEGDHNEPADAVKALGFENGDSYPVWIVRDDINSEDWSLASHSMYNPAGKSNDWIIWRQMFVPSDDYVLTFKGQSYLNDKKDVLKVLVLADEIGYNSISEELIQNFEQNAKVVFEEQLTPGETEDGLAGEWTEYAIPLSEYSGKNIYIAFVNQNEDQSMIFIDDIGVGHDIDFTLSLSAPAQLVSAESTKVEGRLKVASADKEFTSMTFKLKDASGKEIDTKEYSGLNLKYDDILNFEFDKELPLVSGRTNKFSVEAISGDSKGSATGSIDNLFFKPTKRVVIEEGTGQGCSNCPLGHEMLDRLHDAYGNLIIPIAIHTYTGDDMASGLDYYSEFLGITAYPSAAIDRSMLGGQSIFFPMQTVGGQLEYISTNGTPMWWEAVGARLNEGSKAEIEFASWDHGWTQPLYNPETQEIYVPATVRFALDSENENYSLLMVVTEDNVEGRQTNNLFNSTDPLAGEWGKGGALGRPTVKYNFNHVARALYGETMLGYTGYIPFDIKGGENYNASFTFQRPGTEADINNCSVVLMLINANTGQIENAVAAPLLVTTGVEDMQQEASSIVAEEGSIVIRSAGDFTAEVYTTDGKLVGMAHGNDTLTMNVDAQGVVVVRVVNADKATTAKVIL